MALVSSSQAQVVLEDVLCTSFTGSFEQMTINKIQSEFATNGTDQGNCLPSIHDGKFVEVVGEVTAIGATKNSYTSGYFYMQNCEGTTPCPLFSAIEVFHEDHHDDLVVGEIVRVQGYVVDEGATLINACGYAKVSAPGATLIEPLEVTTGTFPLPYHETTNPAGSTCDETVEGYEHMLVSVKSPKVRCCTEAHGYVDGSSYADRWTR